MTSILEVVMIDCDGDVAKNCDEDTSPHEKGESMVMTVSIFPWQWSWSGRICPLSKKWTFASAVALEKYAKNWA
jgi:hypothetical protein